MRHGFAVLQQPRLCEQKRAGTNRADSLSPLRQSSYRSDVRWVPPRREHARAPWYDKRMDAPAREPLHQHAKPTSQSQGSAMDGGNADPVRIMSRLFVCRCKRLQRPSNVDRLGTVIAEDEDFLRRHGWQNMRFLCPFCQAPPGVEIFSWRYPIYSSRRNYSSDDGNSSRVER